jgi:hypothetical protein
MIKISRSLWTDPDLVAREAEVLHHVAANEHSRSPKPCLAVNGQRARVGLDDFEKAADDVVRRAAVRRRRARVMSFGDHFRANLSNNKDLVEELA